MSLWESQAAAFERVFEQQGGVDVVFANAGVTESVDLVKSALGTASSGGPVKPGLKTMEVNLLGIAYCMTCFFFFLGGGGSLSVRLGMLIITAVHLGIH